MRVFATSDIHVDYDENARWIRDLSIADYQDDVLILAGDVTDTLNLLESSLATLSKKFRKVLFVPGNHDLWVIRDDRRKNSLQKFDDVRAAVEASGASMEPFRERGMSIIPLLSWYDYSFGEPSEELRSAWMDYRACRWPIGYTEKQIAAYFAAFNEKHVSPAGDMVITYSHFLPRIDVMPGYIPAASRFLYPILGSKLLDVQLRRLNARMHVYGHSHVNRRVEIDGVSYINNAFGYPSETRITSKRLMCIHEC
ncbi:MAG: calcineurin-like phosphoesterase family protein [Acidobacteria bacterium]|nr:calcineurin-like phosphoesterase family protein [Acidobacteriota bacterium]